MPFANLIIAQAVAGWIAPNTLASLLLPFATGLEPWKDYVIAAMAAVVIVIGGLIGARISTALPHPTLASGATALMLALLAAFLAITFIAPQAAGSEAMTHLTTFAPVAASITGYLLASGKRA